MPKFSTDSSDLSDEEKKAKGPYRIRNAAKLKMRMIKHDSNTTKSTVRAANMNQSRTLLFSADLSTLPPECDVSKHSPDKQQTISRNWRHSQSTSKDKIEFAARWGFISLVDKLIRENQIDINKTAALYTAAIYNEFAMLKHLVEEYRADVNSRGDFLSGTPLQGAIQSGNLDAVNYLVAHGASVEEQGMFSEKPIETCLKNLKNFGNINMKYISILQALISAGASLDHHWKFYSKSPRAFFEELQIKHPSVLEPISVLLSRNDDSSIEDVEAALNALSLNNHDEIGNIVLAFAAASASDLGSVATRSTLKHR